MAFDVQGARKAGYSDAEIADFLGPQRRFDVTQARSAGYSDGEIVDFLLKSAPAPSGGFGTLGGFFRGLPAGAVNLAESAAVGTSALLPDRWEPAVRETIRSTAEAARRPFAGQPGEEGTVTRKLGEAVGSFAPLLPLGALGVAGRLAATGAGVAAGAGEARVRAEEGGASEAERASATGLGAAVGATEVLPVFSFLNRLGAEGAGILNILRRAAITGGQEGLQEAAANVAQNLIEKGVYNPEQGVFTDTGESLGYGAGSGALVSALTDLVLGRRTRGTAQPPEPTPPTEPPAPETALPLLSDMSIGQLYQEEARLSALLDEGYQPKEIADRIKEVRELKKQFNIAAAEDAILRREASRVQAERDRAFAEESAFGQPEQGEFREMALAPWEERQLRQRAEEGQPQAPEPEAEAPRGEQLGLPGIAPAITRDLLAEAGLPVEPKTPQQRGVAEWFDKNVVGRSLEEIKELIQKTPDLIKGSGLRARILRDLDTVTPPPFTESEIGRTADTGLPEPLGPELGGSEPSVELPSPSGPVGGELGAAGAPAAPVGGGVGTAELPAAQGAVPQDAEPLAVTEPSTTVQTLAPFIVPERVTPQTEKVLTRYAATMQADRAEPTEFPRYIGWDLMSGSTFDPQTREITRIGFAPEKGRGVTAKQAEAAFNALTPEAQQRVVQEAQNYFEQEVAAGRARERMDRTQEEQAQELDEAVGQAELAEEYGLSEARPRVTETPTGRRVQGIRYQQDMDAPGNPLPSSVLAELEANNLTDALNELAKSTTDPTYAAVARRLMTLLGNTRVILVDRLVNPDTGQESYGVAAQSGQIIWLSRRIGLNDRTLLHESVHAATESVIRRDPGSISLAQKAAMKEMSDIWDALFRDPKVQLPGEAKYSFSEFVAEVLTSPQLVSVMKTKPWTVGSAWTSFKKALLKLLGIKTPTNMSDAAAAALDTIFEAPPLRHDNSTLGKLRQAYFDAIDTSILTGGAANVNYVRSLPPEQRTKYEQAMVDAEDAFNAEQTRALNAAQAPAKPALKASFQLSPAAETALKALRTGASKPPAAQAKDQIRTATKIRTQLADKAATILDKVNLAVEKGMMTALEGRSFAEVYKQAEAKEQFLPDFYRLGGMGLTKYGTWEVVQGKAVPTEAIELVRKWGASQGKSFDVAWEDAGRLMEANRQYQMREHNAKAKKGEKLLPTTKGFPIDTLYAEYLKQSELIQAKDILDTVRKDLIEKLVSVGRISRATAKEWTAVAEYVPFDRVAFDEKIRPQKVTGRGLSALGRLPEFVDAAVIERPVGNALENYFDVLGWMVQQTVQTHALNKSLADLEKIKEATYLGKTKDRAKNKTLVVRAFKDGEEVFYEVPTQFHHYAFNTTVKPILGFMGVLTKISRALRTTITAVPTFPLVQLPMDIQRAVLVSGVKNPGQLTKKILQNFGHFSVLAAQGKLQTVSKDLTRAAVVGDVDFRANEPTKSLLQELGYADRKTLGSKKLGTLLHRLNEFSRAGDVALRQAIYDQTLEETSDKLLALRRAREIINFRTSGAGDPLGALHFMLQTVPFFGAYVQGTDVLYRWIRSDAPSSMLEKKVAQTHFMKMAGALAAGSMAYALLMADDDDYQKMNLEERDRTWVLGGGIGIPVPTEIGMLFKAIPERLVEYFRTQGTPDERLGMQAITTWFRAAFFEYFGRLAPLPAGVKPILEAWTGYSFRTGRQLEGIFQEGLDAAFKATDSTSEFARAAAQSPLALEISRFTKAAFGVEVSPIIIDNTLNGYFGTTAAMTLMATDALLNPNKADRPLHQFAGLGGYTYNPVGTRMKDEFYDLREKVSSAQNTLNMLADRDVKAALEYAEKNKDRLAAYKVVNATLEQLEKTRAYKRYFDTVEAAQEMSGEERLRQKQEIERIELGLVSWVNEARRQLNI